MGIYMDYDGIKGEATQQDHKKWIDVLSLSWGAGRAITTSDESVVNRLSSGPHLSDVTIVKSMDVSSPQLVNEALAGNEGKTVRIDLTTTGSPSVVYCTYTISNALISSYSVASSADRPTETIGISFTKLEFKFTPYDDKNMAGTPTTVSYDLATTKKSAPSASTNSNLALVFSNISATYDDASYHITAKIGSSSHDYVEGTSASEVLNGLDGNDVILGRSGNDSINGGSGIDIVRYQGMRSQFEVSGAELNVASPVLAKGVPQNLLPMGDMSIFALANGEVRRVTDKLGERSGADTLSEVERIQFLDGKLLFDVPKTDAHSTLYRLYQATLGRSPDEAGFLGWVQQIKNGVSIKQIGKEFINSTEFIQKFSANNISNADSSAKIFSNAEYVDHLYRNALGRESDLAGSAGWIKLLPGEMKHFDGHMMTRAEMAVAFASSQEASVKTAGNTDNGYWVV